jgi:GTP pyrophosphokinase
VYQARALEAPSSPWSSLLNRIRRRSVSPVLITGEDGVLVQFARCCDPLPGEDVVGFITRGKGISVHRTDCDQLGALDSERLIPVEWDSGHHETRHNSQIRIVCRDRPGLLANITKVCELAKVNINGAEARNIGDDRAVCTLDLAIRDVGELKSVIRTLEKIKGVELVERVVV